jgi:polar amino acid transport system substrate-binding protein
VWRHRIIDETVTAPSGTSTRDPDVRVDTRRGSSPGHGDATYGQATGARWPAVARRDVLGGAVLSLLPVLFAPRVAQAAAAEPVRIVYDVFANPPLICGDGTAIDPTTPGLTIQMLRMASKRANVPIELSRTPWRRGLYLIETGQADAIFASSFVEERQRYGVYPFKDGRPDTRRKLFDQSYSLFIRGESEVGWDGKALINLHAPVGATPGYAVVPVLRAMGVVVEEEPDHTANLRKLVAGRLDAYAELETQIRPMLRSDKVEFGSIYELSPPVLTKPYYLMFSKVFYARTPEIAERLWDVIGAVAESAAYQKLVAGGTCAD